MEYITPITSIAVLSLEEAQEMPASVGVMITGMFYAGISFYLGEKIDTVDEHYGFSNDLINKIEAYLK